MLVSNRECMEEACRGKGTKEEEDIGDGDTIFSRCVTTDYYYYYLLQEELIIILRTYTYVDGTKKATANMLEYIDSGIP